jgi:RNA polymerase sigma-70 factor (ECF subfamily)
MERTHPAGSTPGIGERIAAERAYLYAHAARRLGNRERSEDVVQSALLAGLAGAHEYRGKASLRTWLTAILHNRIIDEQRLHRREPLAADLYAGSMPRPETASADASEEVAAFETARRLQRRLEEMPPACSKAFVMRELQGRTTREIRETLGLTPGQFWQSLHKVRRALRAELQAGQG